MKRNNPLNTINGLFNTCLLTMIFMIGARLVTAQEVADPSRAALGVLQQKAKECIERKDYVGLEAMVRAQIALEPALVEAHYNLACALAMQGKNDAALAALTQSVAVGFADTKLLESDTDLTSLRSNPAFAAVKAIAQLNERSAGQPDPAPQPPALPSPTVPATPVTPLVGPPLTRQEILETLTARIGTDGPHPKREMICKEIREEIKKRGVNFKYATLTDMTPIFKAGGNSSVTDAIAANFGVPRTLAWLMGEWDVSVTFVSAGTGAKLGFISIEPNHKYLWKLGADDDPKKWIDGKWRDATSDEMRFNGGAGIVLLGGEQGYDWIVHRDYTAQEGQEWINIADLASRQIKRGGQKAK